jgi:PKD repeat protein
VILRAVALVGLLLGVALTTPRSTHAEVMHVGRRVLGVLPSPGAAHGGGAARARARAKLVEGGSLGVPPLSYWGGPVVHAMTVQVIYWEPTGFALPGAFIAGFDQFMADVAAGDGAFDNVTAVAHQYVDAEGPSLSSLTTLQPIVDSSSFPALACPPESEEPVCLTDEQIRQELAQLLARGAIAPGLDRSYVLVTPPGVRVCLDSAATGCSREMFCGYHSVVGSPGQADTTYTVIPYPEAGCESGEGPREASVDAASTIEAHEMIETATDPKPDSGYVDGSGDEIADECAWIWGETSVAGTGGLYNQVLDGSQYLLQEMYSDENAHCAQGMASLSSATVTASSAVALTGQTVTYTASLQGDPYPAASYEWRYTASSGSYSPVGGGTSSAITFSQPGSYRVWVVITDLNGGSVTAVTQVTVYVPPSATFEWTPAGSPRSGSPVTFEASASSFNGPVTHWSWNFGDGTGASDGLVTHVFPAAGSYSVTLTVTDSAGVSATVTRVLRVTTAPPRIRAKLTHHSGHYKLTVSGSGFSPGRVLLVIGSGRHRWRYRLYVESRGTFTFALLYRRPLRVVSARSLQTR